MRLFAISPPPPPAPRQRSNENLHLCRYIYSLQGGGDSFCFIVCFCFSRQYLVICESVKVGGTPHPPLSEAFLQEFRFRRSGSAIIIFSFTTLSCAPSPISRMVSLDVKHMFTYLHCCASQRQQTRTKSITKARSR